MFQARAQQRSIPGAVATVGVNERVAFLRRTYGHLGAAILAFVGVTYLMVNSPFGEQFTCPSTLAGAVATKNTCCRWTKSRNESSISVKVFPMRFLSVDETAALFEALQRG